MQRLNKLYLLLVILKLKRDTLTSIPLIKLYEPLRLAFLLIIINSIKHITKTIQDEQND